MDYIPDTIDFQENMQWRVIGSYRGCDVVTYKLLPNQTVRIVHDLLAAYGMEHEVPLTPHQVEQITYLAREHNMPIDAIVAMTGITHTQWRSLEAGTAVSVPLNVWKHVSNIVEAIHTQPTDPELMARDSARHKQAQQDTTN